MLDLCSGIGGFTLAAKIAGGFETIAFCDADADCRNLLSTRFPNTPIFEDIKDVSAKSLQQRGIEQIDGITAGATIPYIPRLTSEEVGVLSSTEQAAYKAARAEYQRLRKAHTARIKQLGNSIVPQCAAIAFKILKQRLNF